MRARGQILKLLGGKYGAKWNCMTVPTCFHTFFISTLIYNWNCSKRREHFAFVVQTASRQLKMSDCSTITIRSPVDHCRNFKWLSASSSTVYCCRVCSRILFALCFLHWVGIFRRVGVENMGWRQLNYSTHFFSECFRVFDII